MHLVQQAVLVRALITHDAAERGEVLAHHATGGHLILHVGHVDCLVRLSVAKHVLWHDLHHALVHCGIHLPRVHVQVVPLLDKAACAGARREGCEVGRVHAGCVRGHDSPPVAVDEVSKSVRDVVELVHAGIADQAQGLDEEVAVLELLAALEVQGLWAATLKHSHAILQQAVGTAEERDIADAEPAALRDGDVLWARVDDGVERIRVIENLSALVHGLEHVQQEPGGRGDGALMAEPARETRAGKALAARHQVDLGGAVLAAAADVLDRERPVADNRAACARHLAVIPAELPTLVVVALAVADHAAKLILTGVVDLAVDVIGTREVVDDGGVVGLGAAGLLDAQLVVAVVRILLTDDLKADNVRVEVRILCHAILLHGVLHRAEHLYPHGMVVHTAACARRATVWRGSGALEGLRKDVAALGRASADGTKATVACPDVLVAKPDIEGSEVRLDLGVLRRGVPPGIAAGARVAVKLHEVLVVVHRVLHRSLHALEASPNDGGHVRPRVLGELEVGKA
mmetsp:Transcript_30927/g.83806  ORF Transcript_30927/g.83806 Transcript_30927/m.83806 type:complete len:517 (+) Transcript_30927:821-2371(+)